MLEANELQPEEFTPERFLPVFEAISKESARPFDSRHFFPNWQGVMSMNIARTWAVGDSAVLGAIITPDLFNAEMRAQVVFWFSLPGVRGTYATGAVFKAFEAAAKAAGCVDIQSAAHEKLHPEWRGRGYLKHGFVKTETVYTKSLEVPSE